MPERRDFADRRQLAEALAEAVAENLKAGVIATGSASLAVSGGTTPALFLEALAARGDVPWEKVIVTLVDERWVPETSDRSNARLVKDKLLQGRAAAAMFVPLYQGTDQPDPVAAGLAQASVPQPLDAAVLGMGSDGHTASFFPGGDHLEAALNGQGPVVAITAPGAGEPRVTLTLGRLLGARALYLHIEGEEKARTLDRALGEGPTEAMPVRAILREGATPLTIFWSP